jgi:hypothetical protein
MIGEIKRLRSVRIGREQWSLGAVRVRLIEPVQKTSISGTLDRLNPVSGNQSFGEGGGEAAAMGFWNTAAEAHDGRYRQKFQAAGK